MTEKRIISLLPSATETVCALGFGDRLVGRSHECDYPPQVQALPVCTAPRLNINATSGEIDREVKNLLQNALSIYEIKAETIRALKPDLILTQAQCEVCAVSLPEVQAAVGQWADSKPQILSLSPNRLTQVWEGVLHVADAMGARRQGAALMEQIEERIARATAFSKARRPTVACVEWLDPLMAAGNWVPELVALAGGQDMFGKAGHHSGWIEWTALREADPEILVLMPCGFDLERTRRELHALSEKSEWRRLRAVQSDQVFLTDGSHYFNRPGPRLTESVEILVEILHPAQRHFGHQGKGWELTQPD